MRRWALFAQYEKDRIIGDQAACKATFLAMLENAATIDNQLAAEVYDAATQLDDLSDAEMSSLVAYFDVQAKNAENTETALTALDYKAWALHRLKGRPERSVYKEIIDVHRGSGLKTMPYSVGQAILKYAELAPDNAERLRLYDIAIRDFTKGGRVYEAEKARFEKYLFTGDDSELRAHYDAAIASGDAEKAIRALFDKADLPGTVSERKALCDQIVKIAEEKGKENKKLYSNIVHSLLRKADLEVEDEKKREIYDDILARARAHFDDFAWYSIHRAFLKKLDLARDDRERIEICDAALTLLGGHPEKNSSNIISYLNKKIEFQDDLEKKLALHDEIISIRQKRIGERQGALQLDEAMAARAELADSKEEFVALCTTLVDKYRDHHVWDDSFAWKLAVKKAKATGDFAALERFSAGRISDKASVMDKIFNTVELAKAYDDRTKTLEVFDSLLSQYRNDERENARQSVDWVLQKKVEFVDDPTEKQALLNEILERQADEKVSGWEYTVYNTYQDKLKLAGDDRERVAFYDEALARYGDSASVSMRRFISRMKQARADLLEKMQKN